MPGESYSSIVYQIWSSHLEEKYARLIHEKNTEGAAEKEKHTLLTLLRPEPTSLGTNVARFLFYKQQCVDERSDF